MVILIIKNVDREIISFWEMFEEEEEMASRRKMDWVELYVDWSWIRSNAESIWGSVVVWREESAFCFSSNELR